MDAKDTQRARLYAMEGKFADWNRKTDSLADCRRMVETACAYYNVTPPRVTSHPGRAYSWSQTELPEATTHSVRSKGRCKTVISFNRVRGLNRATALHEAAHTIAANLLPWEMADHDPRFCGLYLWLLCKAKVAPRIALEAAFRAAGVKWRRMPPRTVKARYKAT